MLKVRVGAFNIHCIPLVGCSDEYLENDVAPFVWKFIQANDLHILVLNEAFRAKVMTSVTRRLPRSWSHTAFDKMPGTGVLVFWNTDKVIAKEPPVTKLFTQCCGTDCFASKGAVGMVFHPTNHPHDEFAIIGTHLQDETMNLKTFCGDDVRLSQWRTLRVVRNELQQGKSPLPGMYIGDMNTPPSKDMEHVLGADAVQSNSKRSTFGENQVLDYGLVFPPSVRGKMDVYLGGVNPSDHHPIVVSMYIPSAIRGGAKKNRPVPLPLGRLVHQFQDALYVRLNRFLEQHPNDFAYLRNKDGTLLDFPKHVFGGEKQGVLYTYKDRPNWLLKIGPKGDLVKGDSGYFESMGDGGQFMETYNRADPLYDYADAARAGEKGVTDVVFIQNAMAKAGYAPVVYAAGVFDGYRVTVMQKIHHAVTLKDQHLKDFRRGIHVIWTGKGTLVDKRAAILKNYGTYITKKIGIHHPTTNGIDRVIREMNDDFLNFPRKILGKFARKFRRRGFCHHDLHTTNIVYGQLTESSPEQYFVIDFDNAYRLDDTKEMVCNDDMFLDDDKENVQTTTQFGEATVSMPPRV
jgi:hypothetical protein